VSGGGFYLGLAYVVVLALLLLYVGIIALKLGRLRRQLDEVRDEARDRDEAPAEPERAAA